MPSCTGQEYEVAFLHVLASKKKILMPIIDYASYPRLAHLTTTFYQKCYCKLCGALLVFAYLSAAKFRVTRVLHSWEQCLLKLTLCASTNLVCMGSFLATNAFRNESAFPVEVCLLIRMPESSGTAQREGQNNCKKKSLVHKGQKLLAK